MNRVTRTIILDQGNPESKRAEILTYFIDTFEIDELLYRTLADDSTYFLRPDSLRHPLIFYYGHTAAFFINKLVIAKIIPKRINPRFEAMFAVGVDEMSWDDLNEANYDWPHPLEVLTYRTKVRETVIELIQTLPLTMPITWESPFWAILMGIEHERIHLETSSVLIRQLPLDQVCQLPEWDICPDQTTVAPNNTLIPVSSGLVTLGKPMNHALYGWDNEYGQHESPVAGFNAARFLVSNSEFKEFVDEGGYREPAWWSEEGWNWRTFRQANHPLFWVADGADWRLRTMANEIPLPWSWPVEVNYLEAKAFCTWKSARTGRSLRLPTEDEWTRLRDNANLPDQPYWDTAPGNINLEYWASSCPVDRFQHGDFFDIIGNVWQWTETPIFPFRGFKIHPWYDDFSTPTFDSRHNLIKGGSWISTGNEATRDARYAFRRHFFQHAGFRYVESSAPISIHQAPYETDTLAAQYCHAHYGEEYLGVPNFQKTCAAICLELMQGRQMNHALDIGCSVGRAAFELAKGGFSQVTGLDFSTRFFRLATRMQEEGFLRYAFPEEGEIASFHEITLQDLGLEQVRNRVTFSQADACNIPDKFNGYDLVLAANLIDRLYSPRRFLASIHTHMQPHGFLVLTSPYSWSEDFTKKEEWLGGHRESGEPAWSLAGITSALSPRFTLVREPHDIPCVIRETRRKYQYIVSQMSIWRLNG